MKIKKRLNNNVVIAVDSQSQESILSGKGLGFGVEAGNEIDMSLVEKKFTLSNSKENQRLQELVETIPVDFIVLSEELITYSSIHLGNKINENVLVSLSDHIYTAIERQKQGIELRNVMLWDIQRFYADEYEVGKYALDLIKEKFGINLSDDEAGFIALHIINGQLSSDDNSVKGVTEVIHEIETIVRHYFSIELDSKSVHYYRFISHLKFFAERLFTGERYESTGVSEMLALVKNKYPEAWQCSLKIETFILNKYHYEITDDELLYLSIHIAKIVNGSR